MRNYRDLTPDEIAELERLYPITPNRELSRRFDVSVDAIRERIAIPRHWQKDHKAVQIGNRGGASLNEQQVAWIVRHYKHTKNEDIMRRFGIGEATLHRVARKHGLKKSRQQMRKMQAEATEEARRVGRSYGLYDELAERQREKLLAYSAAGLPIPGGFQPGESNRDRLGPERFRECIDKAHRKRNATIRRDRARLAFGLPQRSKLRLSTSDTRTLRKRAHYRWQLGRHNYIVEYGAMTIYYDEETRRSPLIERRAAALGFQFVSDMPDVRNAPDPTPQPTVRVIHPPRDFETW